MYQLTNSGTIKRLMDGALIPPIKGNIDYEAFLAWSEAGNLAEPAPLPDQKAVIRAAIDSLERATGVVRVVREALMMFAELEAARRAAAMTEAGTPTTAAQLLAMNPGYVRTKAVDDQISQLRARLA
jgi:hypothetical protein